MFLDERGMGSGGRSNATHPEASKVRFRLSWLTVGSVLQTQDLCPCSQAEEGRSDILITRAFLWPLETAADGQESDLSASDAMSPDRQQWTVRNIRHWPFDIDAYSGICVGPGRGSQLLTWRVAVTMAGTVGRSPFPRRRGPCSAATKFAQFRSQ